MSNNIGTSENVIKNDSTYHVITTNINKIIDYISYEFISTEFFLLGLSSLIGVSIRVSITQSLNTTSIPSDTINNYGPFLQLFFSQPYLVSNMLGSFIMAVCICNMKSITRVSRPLYVGLTTGLCGCITTYSSWMNTAINHNIDYIWFNVFVMIGIEFSLTWTSFTFGFMVSKSIKFLIARIPPPLIRLIYLPMKDTVTEHDPVIVISPLDRYFSTNETNNNINESNKSVEISKDDNKVVSEIFILSPYIELIPAPNPNKGSWYRIICQVFELIINFFFPLQIEKESTHSNEINKYVSNNKHIEIELSNNDNQTDEQFDITVDTTKLPIDATELYYEKYFNTTIEYYIFSFLFIVIISVIWLILIFEKYISSMTNIPNRNMVRSIGLAPLGVWLRWYLSKNSFIKNLIKHMHMNTLLANLFAVTFVCLLTVFASHNSWVFAINNGFNGSLSTVSTFIAEIHTLYYLKGPIYAIRYAGVTFFISMLIIVIIRR